MSKKEKTAPKDDFAYWVGRAEARRLRWRFIFFPFLFAAAVIFAASIIQMTIASLSPESAAAVAHIFGIETFREKFPKAANVYSFLAKRDGWPWDLVAPPLLMLNMVVSWSTSALASLLIFVTPFKSIGEIGTDDSELITRTRDKLLGQFFIFGAGALLFAFVASMIFSGASDLDRAWRRPRDGFSAAIAILALQFLVMALPFWLVGFSFLVKFRWMLGRLQRRSTLTP